MKSLLIAALVALSFPVFGQTPQQLINVQNVALAPGENKNTTNMVSAFTRIELAPNNTTALFFDVNNVLRVQDAITLATQKVLLDGTSGQTLVNPIIKNGLTASGSVANDFSGSTGNFKTSTGSVTIGGAATATAGLLDSSPTAGIGYTSGAGGAVTQITSRTTGVTLNTLAGAITLFTAAGSATAATFTVADSSVGVNDVIHLSQKSGANLYEIFVTAVAAGSFNITQFTTGGTTSEAPVFNFVVIKGSIN